MKKSINIGWLYPDLMNTYGDSGNIIAIKKRSEWRNIVVNIIHLNNNFNPNLLKKTDFIFMGGAQDRQQEIVFRDLRKKGSIIKKIIENGMPGLFICGAYQFLCKFYKGENGKHIKGLGIIDAFTECGSYSKRLIGNIAVRTNLPLKNKVILGFENHGGRTFIGKKTLSFGTVMVGNGNNGIDKSEGVIFNNIICTYLHGPILPINPELCDYIIKNILEKKYKTNLTLKKIDNEAEDMARKTIASNLHISL